MTAFTVLWKQLWNKINKIRWSNINWYLTSNKWTDKIPTDPQKVTDGFHGFMESILKRNKKHRFVLVLDGLDNLDGKDNNQDLIWFPTQFPSMCLCVCVGLVVSLCVFCFVLVLDGLDNLDGKIASRFDLVSYSVPSTFVCLFVVCLSLSVFVCLFICVYYFFCGCYSFLYFVLISFFPVFQNSNGSCSCFLFNRNSSFNFATKRMSNIKYRSFAWSRFLRVFVFCCLFVLIFRFAGLISFTERLSLLRLNLNMSSKKLSEQQEFRIAKSNQCGNPR
jgi:hypothetical protein